MQTSSVPLSPIRRVVRAAGAAAVALTAIGAGVAAAQTGSDWTQFQGGSEKSGASLAGPEPAYRQAWRTPIEPAGPDGRFGLSAPVVAEGIAVVVGPEQVIGLDVGSGEQVFSVARDVGPSVPAAAATIGDRTTVAYTEGWGEGPPGASGSASAEASASGSPAPSDDGDGSIDSHLAAFDLADQQPPWPAVPLDGVSRTGVTISGDTAFVGVNEGTVTAVDLADGSVAWRSELDALLVTPLTAADGLVLAGLQGDRDTQPVVVALDAASGEERWRYVPASTAAVVSAVSIDEGTAFAIVTGASETSLVAVDIADGTERWHHRVNAAFDVIAPPVASDGTVFVTDLIGHSRAFDAGSGDLRWDFAQNAPVFRSVPVLVGSYLLVPTLEGELGAIDAETGELVWRLPADGSSLRTLAVAGDVVIAVRGGARSGVEAWEHAPSGALVREASPTTLDLGRMAGAMVVAAAVVLAVVLLLGRMLAARKGAAFLEAGEDVAADDGQGSDEAVRDPWEDEDPVV